MIKSSVDEEEKALIEDIVKVLHKHNVLDKELSASSVAAINLDYDIKRTMVPSNDPHQHYKRDSFVLKLELYGSF